MVVGVVVVVVVVVRTDVIIIPDIHLPGGDHCGDKLVMRKSRGWTD